MMDLGGGATFFTTVYLRNTGIGIVVFTGQKSRVMGFIMAICAQSREVFLGETRARKMSQRSTEHIWGPAFCCPNSPPSLVPPPPITPRRLGEGGAKRSGTREMSSSGTKVRVRMNKSRMSCKHGRTTGPTCINFYPCGIGVTQPGETQGPAVQWAWKVRAKRGLEHINTAAFQKRKLAEEEGASSRSGTFKTNTQTRH